METEEGVKMMSEAEEPHHGRSFVRVDKVGRYAKIAKKNGNSQHLANIDVLNKFKNLVKMKFLVGKRSLMTITGTVGAGEVGDMRNATAGVLHRLRFSRKNPLCKFKFKTFTLERRGE